MGTFRRFRRLGLFLYILAFFGSVGGHWLLAQSVAWASMAVQYSQKSSVSQGLKETFDGKHPCQLCHEIQDGKESESKREAPSARIELKFDTYSRPSAESIDRVSPVFELARLSISAEARPLSLSQAPPIPPPRA